MARQDRWTDDRDRERSAQEDRFRRGLGEDRGSGGYGAGRYSEAYGDYGRSFERDRTDDRREERGEDRAYAAGYGIDEGGYGDRRYGGQWGRGPGEGGYSGQSYGDRTRSGAYGDYGMEDDRDRDRTWMERTGERIASWFGGGEGERSHRGRGPKNYTRADERIRDDVNEWLTDDPYVDASEIEVAVAGGEVTLSGMVTTRADRRRAEDLAERVSGVRHVQNNIRVVPPEDRPLPVPMV